MSNQHQIKTESGLTINPIESIQGLLSGTSFKEDRIAQELLTSLGDSLYEISKTTEGKVMLGAMEGLAGQIKTRDSIQGCCQGLLQTGKKDDRQPMGAVWDVHWVVWAPGCFGQSVW